ncbi:GTP-binding protein [Maricurvus nonylphenolicus]|uniref:CobW family GTP-binding protein n=1 Tax=Maricurvus nonylphenolicus TaxID=1008307 RepID=UPI0036F33A37
MNRQHPIPTNVITGFLGAGKTTLIQHLLKTKPADEHWAVLVNEFGEVGLDGALLAAEGIAVKEVPGGCMCCTTSLPSKSAMNQLIEQQNPDRILIEPTGLAHPKQILQSFGGKAYQGILDMHAVVCVLDPWSLSDDQFLALPAFRDQIQLADVLIATKSDTSAPEHLARFDTFAASLKPMKSQIGKISQGNMPWQWLDAPRVKQTVILTTPASHSGASSSDVAERDSDGVLRQENKTDYGYSCGWLFPETFVFNFEGLKTLLSELEVPRIKAVMQTDKGWFSFNRMRENFQAKETTSIGESRLEVVSMEPVDWRGQDNKLRLLSS